MSFVQIQTTFEEEADLNAIADLLLKDRLAACIQIIPIKSIYKWKDVINKENEFLCLIKTKDSLVSEIIELIKKNHSYENPEIIVTDILDGSNEYFDWIEAQTK